ncbi:hypothetical protein DYB25_007872 [Aphanomyces astaci]|uniref:methylmalonate-semialdehyde dehydrogenase (CoA acylating) n=1 Tax=Aphanomyces astaci TaxID=112090 RepID=A0A397BBM1_APHAT|nr:hypothetical protein DYB25_007872 [Aphanomyces astaci]RHY24452.1 hypothetical protein DYB36_008339 [Aphanomyces astaci]RHZ13236.1 hypothetical protein DYB31_008098 [Aphanomyces astaci]
MPPSPTKRSKKGENSATEALVCDNFIHGVFTPAKGGEYLDVESPTTGDVIGKVALSAKADVDAAVAYAKAAFGPWSSLTVKARAAIMLKFHELIRHHVDELADLVVLENGKNKSEAVASVLKGNETVEYACSLPQLLQGRVLEVSRGITCHETRDPLGIIVSIVPFNFPVMVPLWTVPIALTTGNCVILKPSEKVPATMTRIAQLLAQAGVPPGVFQIVHGQAPSVTALVDHPDVHAVTFVGSSPVAQLISRRCRAIDKRVLALGGAKNHLVALPDASVEATARDVVASFAGCAGQRCMAASVLLVVGNCSALVDAVVVKATALTRGTGPGQAEAGGATVLVDGRGWAHESKGYWVGPTVLVHTNPSDAALHHEIFGPVLSIYQVREPFSFGGMYGTQSKYGDMDITGDGCVEFCTHRRKITAKWSPSEGQTTAVSAGVTDRANFAGHM